MHKYFVIFLFSVGVRSEKFKICVPAMYLADCQKMVKTPTATFTELVCVPARDRLECLKFVQQKKADFVPADPEDMYIASKMKNQDFVIFLEYRTMEEPYGVINSKNTCVFQQLQRKLHVWRDLHRFFHISKQKSIFIQDDAAQFRYEAAMVVNKKSNISDLDQLKGQKSCHTGINRNVGYMIPLVMLMKRDVFPKMNDYSISPKENELRALSSFFAKSCIVGTWSPDPQTNKDWKLKYRNLCELCDDITHCDYPDSYSGYEGALLCLVRNVGDIAFTKVYYVRKFFGLLDNSPAIDNKIDADEYEYLCTDGSKVPIREKPCSWAARPWQGLLGHNDVLLRLSPLREKVKMLAQIGNKKQTGWYTNVLGLSSTINNLIHNIPIKPKQYLLKANYTEIIERGHGPPEPVVRICVSSEVALAKCRDMAAFAFSRDIRPIIDCVLESTDVACYLSVESNGADLVSVDGLKVIAVAEKYNLLPVVQEVYGDKKTPIYAVVVARKTARFKTFASLEGKQSCHLAYGSYGGLAAPLYYIMKQNSTKPTEDSHRMDPVLLYSITKTKVKCLQKMAEFFSRSCFLDNEKNRSPAADGVTFKDEKQCPIDMRPQHCLESSDVAFVTSLDLHLFEASRHELLCVNKPAETDSLSKYTSCNIAMVPSRIWLSTKTNIANMKIAHALLSVADLSMSRKDLFKMFGEYLKNNDVLFKNHATGLAVVNTKEFDVIKDVYRTMKMCSVTYQ